MAPSRYGQVPWGYGPRKGIVGSKGIDTSRTYVDNGKFKVIVPISLLSEGDKHSGHPTTMSPLVIIRLKL